MISARVVSQTTMSRSGYARVMLPPPASKATHLPPSSDDREKKKARSTPGSPDPDRNYAEAARRGMDSGNSNGTDAVSVPAGHVAVLIPNAQ